MYDLHRFVAELLGVDQEGVQPSWDLVGLMYRHIQLQHRAIGLALDILQDPDPETGYPLAADHPEIGGLLASLTGVYAAVATADTRTTAIVKRQLDQITPDPDQLTPEQSTYDLILEARRAGLSRL